MTPKLPLFVFLRGIGSQWHRGAYLPLVGTVGHRDMLRRSERIKSNPCSVGWAAMGVGSPIYMTTKLSGVGGTAVKLVSNGT